MLKHFRYIVLHNLLLKLIIPAYFHFLNRATLENFNLHMWFTFVAHNIFLWGGTTPYRNKNNFVKTQRIMSQLSLKLSNDFTAWNLIQIFDHGS